MFRSRSILSLAVGATAVAALALAAIGCSDGEDRPDVEVIGTSNSVSVTGAGEAVAGKVEPKPAGATQVDVKLGEWHITPAQSTVPKGKVYFLVDNAGPEDAHEFVIIKTDLAPDKLPAVEGKVPEDKVDLVDEIEPYLPASKASIALDLAPGKYVLICNIAEVEDGKLESHYELGMHAAFTVTE